MSDVGVRDLKKHLSEYLERAGKGDVIRITDRGRPKAMLTPLPGRLRIDEGVAEGWITAGSGARLRPTQRVKAKRSILESLYEDRES